MPSVYAGDLNLLLPYFPGPLGGVIVRWNYIQNTTGHTVDLVASSELIADDELFVVRDDSHVFMNSQALLDCAYTAGVADSIGVPSVAAYCPNSMVRPAGWTLISGIPNGAYVTLGLYNWVHVAPNPAHASGTIEWQWTYIPSTSSSTSLTSSSLSSLSTSSTSLSSSSTFSYESSDIDGITYYSEFEDINAINNPIVDNNTKMQFNGYWEKDWLPSTLEFNEFGYGLKRTLNSRGSIYCTDASRLFSMQSGYVGMTVSLPFPITDGVYLPLKNDSTEFNECLLFGVNVGRYETSQPSLYASLTPRGIEFTVWTSAGKHTICDSTTTIAANTNVFFEFAWDNTAIDDYLARTIIRVNNIDIASSNMPINNDSISNLNFYVLNTPFSYNNFECTIRNLKVYDIIPADVTADWWSSSSVS